MNLNADEQRVLGMSLILGLTGAIALWILVGVDDRSSKVQALAAVISVVGPLVLWLWRHGRGRGENAGRADPMGTRSMSLPALAVLLLLLPSTVLLAWPRSSARTVVYPSTPTTAAGVLWSRTVTLTPAGVLDLDTGEVTASTVLPDRNDCRGDYLQIADNGSKGTNLYGCSRAAPTYSTRFAELRTSARAGRATCESIGPEQWSAVASESVGANDLQPGLRVCLDTRDHRRGLLEVRDSDIVGRGTDRVTVRSLTLAITVWSATLPY